MNDVSRSSRFRAVVSGPGELLLALRMLAWAVLLPGLKRMLPLPRLVTAMVPRRRHAPDERRVDVVVTLAACVE